MMITFLLCHMLGVSSSCTNPILYGFLNDNFVKAGANLSLRAVNKLSQSFAVPGEGPLSISVLIIKKVREALLAALSNTELSRCALCSGILADYAVKCSDEFGMEMRRKCTY